MILKNMDIYIDLVSQ